MIYHGSKSRRRARYALIVVLMLLAAGASPAREDVATVETRANAATLEGRLRIFDEVWETVRTRYYDPSLNGLEWDALGAKYRKAATEAHGQDELYSIIRRMLAHLNDAHTRVFAPGEGTDWRETRRTSVGLSLRMIDGEIVVADVARDSEAERAGLRAGDAIVSVDGEPIASRYERFLQELQPHQSLRAKTSLRASMRQRAIAKLFDGPAGAPISVVFMSAGRATKTVVLRRTIVVRTPELRVSKESKNIGLVEFNLFTPEIASGLARALKNDLKSVRALVIDLRENGGGEAEAMTDAASLFLAPGQNLGRFTDRRGRATLEPRTRTRLLSTADAPARFAGPVVLLTSARTASAAEVFAASLRELRRTTVVIGEETCGCVLGIRRRHMLPDGGILDVSEMDYRTESGTRLEGKGLAPDERIMPTRRSLREGNDEALKSALKVLNRALSH